MTEFLLIRHGETDWNKALRFQGQMDVPLNAIGREQAQRLRQRIESQLPEWGQKGAVPVHVVTSDLTRARETAEPLAQAMGHAVEVLEGLREQNFGIFEGLQVAEIKTQYPQYWAKWIEFDAEHAIPEAESTRLFYERVLRTLDALAQRFVGQQVVVVTHGGVLDMLWRHAKGQSLHGPRVCDIPNAGVNQLRHGPQGSCIVQWADTAHLHDMPAQPVYRQTHLQA
mgnify:CR=1 FL=1